MRCNNHLFHSATHTHAHTHTHTHTFNGPFSGTTQVSRYQKGKTNLDFTEARDSEWQWHQLGHMQVCTSLQTDTTPAPHRSVFLQAGCPSCRPTNSVKALKAQCNNYHNILCTFLQPNSCNITDFVLSVNINTSTLSRVTNFMQ